LVMDPVRAYVCWMMLVCAVTYISMAWVLRRFGLRDLTAAFGAFVFAFGLPRTMQICHQQLLPDLFSPLAVYWAWQFLTRPRVLALAGLLASSYLQVLSSICLGWFLLFGLGVFFCWMVGTHGGSVVKLAGFLRRAWLPSVMLLATWGLMMMLLLNVYREANAGFQRDWSECRAYQPMLPEWVLPHRAGLFATLTGWNFSSPNREGCNFLGIVVLVLVFLGLGLSVSRSRILSRDAARPVLAILGTALTLVLLSMQYGPVGSLWWPVYHWVPGGAGIRAVGRIVLIVQLFALIGGLLTLESVLRALVPARPGTRTVLTVAILVIGALEQAPMKLDSFDCRSFYAEAEELAGSLKPGTTAYLSTRSDMEWYTSELLAMWAGLHANRPVVNGYSGRVPENYPAMPMSSGEVLRWLNANSADHAWSGKLLYVVPTQVSPVRYQSTIVEVDRAHPGPDTP
jgi:hypothetical protein